ncbi:hypothetical protein PPL_09920 [Heterostelium album PN500]|uniref:AB hydrolase-1 domain-containing protein n=1 Tax=Heterostelium pallidum (strain ATCC 26659 / Pp 5 / PN500) TaxID=670386 RepID=D3BPQ3_HETP5|nr:hypothetical protein PPL_09920 [Heterostelium album PN500]EFA76615.1 hypothetical protein PPL_09920 [Heterostelium album PN500]|eukprot:XP_020428747.1 hypothetical protein PPL_09920 [Heterostelium album PN500]
MKLFIDLLGIFINHESESKININNNNVSLSKFGNIIRCGGISSGSYRNTINSINVTRSFCTAAKPLPIELEYNIINPTSAAKTGLDNSLDNIIILHGLFGAGSNWRSISPKIANESNCNVIQVDQRNHGSTKHVDEFNLLAMVEDLNLLIKSKNVKNLSLIGHSMGGKVAMLYALFYPESIHKLLIVDISPHDLTRDTMDDFRRYLLAMKSLDLTTIKSRTQVEKYFEPVEQNIVIRRFLLTNLTLDENQNYKWRVNIDSLLANLHELSRFPAPPGARYLGDTLFLGGGNSNFIREKDYPLIRKYFPNAQIEIIPNTVSF